MIAHVQTAKTLTSNNVTYDTLATDRMTDSCDNVQVYIITKTFRSTSIDNLELFSKTFQKIRQNTKFNFFAKFPAFLKFSGNAKHDLPQLSLLLRRKFARVQDRISCLLKF